MYWYHTLELPDGGGGTIVTPGEYDLRNYLPKYGLPDDLSGKSVLDVGAADGFFSYEFERRGAARVVALDVSYYPDVPFHEVARFGCGSMPGGFHRFDIAHTMLDSQVEHVDRSVYDLDEEFGTFDFVFCGSLLLHLSDPFRALEGIRRVARGRVIIATAYYHERLLQLYERLVRLGLRLRNRKTAMTFAALIHNEMNLTYWVPTTSALIDMVKRTGFTDPSVYSTFDLNRTMGRRGWPHAVIHASV